MTTGLGCTIHPCEYNTDSQVPADTDFNIKVQLLQIHEDSVHNGGGGEVCTPGSKAKMDTFTVKELKIHWKKKFVTKYQQFLARKEQAKIKRRTVSHEVNDVSAVESQASQPETPSMCSHCTGKIHGPATFKTRKMLCPAFNHLCEKCNVRGHYQKTCFKCSYCGSWGHHDRKSKWCKKGDKQQKAEAELAFMLSAMSMSFVGQEVGVIDSVADLRIAAIGNGKRGRKIPVGHHIFRNNTWVREPSAPQPTC